MNEFPEFFLRDGESLLRYSFECGVGWKQIIRDFCLKVKELTKNNSFAAQRQIVKEKFGVLEWQGGLSFPIGADIEYESLKQQLKFNSRFVCELTGEVGAMCVNSHGCYKTLSAAKAKEMGYKKV